MPSLTFCFALWKTELNKFHLKIVNHGRGFPIACRPPHRSSQRDMPSYSLPRTSRPYRAIRRQRGRLLLADAQSIGEAA